jgi:hypothetical protein
MAAWLGRWYCVPEVEGSNSDNNISYKSTFFKGPWRSALELLSIVPWAPLFTGGVPLYWGRLSIMRTPVVMKSTFCAFKFLGGGTDNRLYLRGVSVWVIHVPIIFNKYSHIFQLLSIHVHTYTNYFQYVFIHISITFITCSYVFPFPAICAHIYYSDSIWHKNIAKMSYNAL